MKCENCGHVQRDSPSRRRGRLPKVYFLRRPDGAIKIGYTGDIGVRIKELSRQQGCDLQLLAWKPGGRDAEAALHKRFWRDRLDGEWFHPSGRLLAYVDKIVNRSTARDAARTLELGLALERALEV